MHELVHTNTQLCPARIETNLSFLLSHTHIVSHTHSIYKAAGFPALGLGQHGFRRSNPFSCPLHHPCHFHHVIQTSSIQGPPQGRGYTTTTSSMSPTHQMNTQTYRDTTTSSPIFLLHLCSHYQRIWTSSMLSVSVLPWEQQAHSMVIIQQTHTHS